MHAGQGPGVLRLAWYLREVGLEAEHDGGVLEVANGADLANVLDDQLVCFPHICKRVGGAVAVSVHARR